MGEKLKEHSAPYLKKLSKKELALILNDKETYGECTMLRVRYILTDDRFK